MIYLALSLIIASTLMFLKLYRKGQQAKYWQMKAEDRRVVIESLQKALMICQQERDLFEEKSKNFETQLKNMKINEPWILKDTPPHNH